MAAARKPAKQERLHLKLRSFDHSLLDGACRTLTKAARGNRIVVEGPVPLPVQSHRVVPEASFGRMHVRRLTLVNPPPTFIAEMATMSIPQGVEISMSQA